MTRPAKLSEMRATVRELADQETISPTDAFADDDQLDKRINEGLRELYGLLIEVRGQEYYHEETNFTSVVGQEVYELPVRFLQLLGIRASDGTYETQMPIWQYQMLATLRNTTSSGTDSIYRFHYRLQAENVNIQPAPQSTRFTFYVDYIPEFNQLTGPDSTFDGANGWEKWACFSAAIDIAHKEDNYELAQLLTAKQAKLEAQIRKLAPDRDAGLPQGTQDTRRDWGGRRGRRGLRGRWTDPDGYTWRR